VSGLTGSVAIACAAAEAHGTPWQSVINGLRSSLQDIWRSLPVEEQSRFLRHVRPLWDAHRHRLPPEVHGRVKAEFDEGRAVLLRGSVTSVERDADGFRLTLRPRGSPRLETLTADLAFDCTGHRPDLSSPLIQSLVAQGAVREDAHRLGLAVQPNGQVLSKSGPPTRGLFALGPLGQGSLWEITSVPEIVRQCDAAAQSLAALEPSAEREVELSS
jgi:uncharacterized NAD(P)/FAD-binding protein YdhS